MGILGWIILGGLAGWAAAAIMKERQGCVTNIIVGIIGALLGGFLFSLIGNTTPLRFNLWGFFVAVIGSIILIALARAFRGRRRYY